MCAQQNAEAMAFFCLLPVVMGVGYVAYRQRFESLASPQLVHSPYMVGVGHCGVHASRWLACAAWRCQTPDPCAVVSLALVPWQVELRARRLLSELDASAQHSGAAWGSDTSVSDAEDRASADAEKTLLISAVRSCGPPSTPRPRPRPCGPHCATPINPCAHRLPGVLYGTGIAPAHGREPV